MSYLYPTTLPTYIVLVDLCTLHPLLPSPRNDPDLITARLSDEDGPTPVHTPIVYIHLQVVLLRNPSLSHLIYTTVISYLLYVK